MLELLKGLLMFAGIAVLAAITTDIAITTYNRAHGTPSIREMYERYLQEKNDIIEAQRVTIKSQQSEIWIHKKRISEHEKQIEELKNELSAKSRKRTPSKRPENVPGND